jgi:Phasin protein
MPNPAPFEIPTEMRAFVERSLERAKLAFDKFMDAAQSTMNTFDGQSNVAQTSAKEVTQKIKDFAERHVATAFDHAQKLVQAKDAQSLTWRIRPISDAGAERAGAGFGRDCQQSGHGHRQAQILGANAHS